MKTSSDHPVGKKLVPLGGGMQQNPNAKSDVVPGSKAKAGSPSSD